MGYVVDPENLAEMARLTKQAALVTRRSGHLPPSILLREDGDVLDIGCGPGEWVLSLSKHMPSARMTGIDISSVMIAYAEHLAREQHQDQRVTFLVMDAAQPLDFPDQSFDLVHLRFVNAFLSTQLWPHLLQECKRLLRPGGYVVSMETESLGISNSDSLTRYNHLMIAYMRRLGQCFGTSLEGTGITAAQASLLRDAGFEILNARSWGFDYAYGAAVHAAVAEDWTTLLKLLQPPFVQHQLATQEELDVLYERVLSDMYSPGFVALGTAHQVWAVSETQTAHTARADNVLLCQPRLHRKKKGGLLEFYKHD